MNEWINDGIFTYEIGMRKRKIVLADKFRGLISVGDLLSSIRHTRINEYQLCNQIRVIR